MQKYLEDKFIDILKKLNYYNADIKPVFEKPKHEKFGDASTNIAMMLSKSLKKKPIDIANEILNLLEEDKNLSNIEIAGPGFINLSFSNEFYFSNLANILSEGNNFGKCNKGNGKKAMVEFVSANPTGLLHLGHGRQAAIGDAVSNMLSWTGYNVTREYYFNNAGRQMKMLADSVYARYMQIFNSDYPFPEDGYHGEYIREIANQIYLSESDKYKTNFDFDYFKQFAEKYLFEKIKKTLEKLEIKFDVFFNEDSLYKDGKINEVVSELKEKGYIFEKDGATWFSAEKVDSSLEPRVIIKSTGEPTYRLPDIAYHREKIKRGFNLIVDIFGADHIATIPDVLAALKALEFNTNDIRVLIHQFVTLVKNGEIVKMSKRNADMVTLDELIDEVGKDAVRYFLINRTISSHLEFDINLAMEQSEKNPVYYIQYAHARIASIIRFAETENINLNINCNYSLLNSQEELALVKMLIQFPQILEISALNFEPHKICSYLYEVCSTFHRFYHDHRVITENIELSLARLALCQASKYIIGNGLAIIGVSAPERM